MMTYPNSKNSTIRILFRLIYVVVLFLVDLNLHGKDILTDADSLFNNKQYTEALALYDSLYLKYSEVSPAMLLRMAFIKEGLEEYAYALYYLTKFYQQTGERKTLIKIREIANQYELDGYLHSDIEFFVNVYQKYREKAVWLAFLCIIALGIWTYIRKLKGETAYLTLFLQFLLITIFCFFSYNSIDRKEAIIKNSNTLLLAEPSASGEIIESINKGHKVRVLNMGYPWVKIDWKGYELFVKSTGVLFI